MAGKDRLIRNVVGQMRKRISNLPKRTIQNIVIDARGQSFKNNTEAIKIAIEIRRRISTQGGSQYVRVFVKLKLVGK